jgi:hypothetical protein
MAWMFLIWLRPLGRVGPRFVIPSGSFYSAVISAESRRSQMKNVRVSGVVQRSISSHDIFREEGVAG